MRGGSLIWRQTQGFILYLFDESQAVARAYGAERTPEVFLFDQQGQFAITVPSTTTTTTQGP